MKKVLIKLIYDIYLDKQYYKDNELTAYLHEVSSNVIYVANDGFFYGVVNYTILKELDERKEASNQSLISCIGEKPSEITIKF